MSKPKVTPAPPGPQASAPPLEQIPFTHHAVPCAISKADAALALLRLAEEHYDGEDFEFMSTICCDAIDEALREARIAYDKAVGAGKAVAS